MKTIASLFLPISWKGSIFHKVANLFFLVTLPVCYAASAYTNYNGVDQLFASFPKFIRIIFQFLALVADPVIWISFTLAALSLITFKVLQDKKEVRDICFQETDYKIYKVRLILATIIFSAMCLAFTGTSYLFSKVGGELVMKDYIQQVYKPAKNWSQTFDATIQKFDSREKELATALTQLQAPLLEEKASLEAILEYKWQRDPGEKKWGKEGSYQRYKTTKVQLTQLNAQLKEQQDYYQKELANHIAFREEALQAAKSDFDSQENIWYQAEDFSFTLVQVTVPAWTILSLIMLFINLVLTYDKFVSASYKMLGFEVRAQQLNFEQIQKSLMEVQVDRRSFPMKKLLVKQAKSYVPRQRMTQPKRAQAKPFKKIGFNLDTTIEQVSHLTNGFKASAGLPKTYYFEESIGRIANPARYLEKHSDIVYEIEQSNLTGMEIAQKHGISLSTVDQVKKVLRKAIVVAV